MDGLDEEFDEQFLDELLRLEAVASRNPKPTPAPVPQEPVAVTAAIPIAASYPSSSCTAAAPLSYIPAAIPIAASYPSYSTSAPPLPHVPAAPHASASSAFPLSHIAPAPASASASAAVRYSPPRELSQLAAASGSGVLSLAPATGLGFSPPRELSQRPSVAEESDCWIVGAVGSAGGDRVRGVGARRERDAREAERERRDVERLKKELNRVSKQMNDLKNEYSVMKRVKTQQDLEIKAKEAEIQNLKKANVGYARKDICTTGMDIDQSLHTPANGALHAEGSCWTSTRRAEKSNVKSKELRSSRDVLCLNERHQTDASEVLELKHQMMTDNRASTSGGFSLEGCAHLESKSSKFKEIKTTGVQTDLPCNNEHLERKKVLVDSNSSNLCAIWGRPANGLLGKNLISKILVSCSEEILTLFHSTRLPDKCETSSEASSSMNNAISEVYDIIIKMNSDAIPIQTLLEALINLCAVGNAVVVGRALLMLHSILQNLLTYGTKSNQRNNVYIGMDANNIMEMERNNHEGSSALLNTPDAEKLLKSQDGLHIGDTFLPPTFWISFFTAMLQIGMKHSEESIRIDALSIMILIVRTSDPRGEREKFGFTSVMESLHQLLQKENGLLVKKHSVHLLFLLLNCPAILKLLCSGGRDGSEQMEAVGCENDRSQQAISSVLKDLSEYLACEATTSLELKLCRQVVILLAYIASSGKLGYEVLLGSVTAHGANFLELIMEVLASQMECEVDFSTEVHELLKERYLLMREALILLNRLASHANFSKPTLEVLTSSKLCSPLTIDIANRLPQRSKYPLRHLSEINPQMANDLAELAQKFRSRVYGFLEEQHSKADRSSPSASHKNLHQHSGVPR